MTKVHLQKIFAEKLMDKCSGCGKVLRAGYYTVEFKKYCSSCYEEIEVMKKASKVCSASL